MKFILLYYLILWKRIRNKLKDQNKQQIINLTKKDDFGFSEDEF